MCALAGILLRIDATIEHLLHIAGELQHTRPRKAVENGIFLVLKRDVVDGCKNRDGVRRACGGIVPCYSVSYINQTLILVAVAWTRDEGGGKVGIVGATEHHRELAKRNGSHHQIARHLKWE